MRNDAVSHGIFLYKQKNTTTMKRKCVCIHKRAFSFAVPNLCSVNYLLPSSHRSYYNNRSVLGSTLFAIEIVISARRSLLQTLKIPAQKGLNHGLTVK